MGTPFNKSVREDAPASGRLYRSVLLQPLAYADVVAEVLCSNAFALVGPA